MNIKRIIAGIIFLLCFTTVARANVYIISPKPGNAPPAVTKKTRNIPFLLRQKVSLIGSMNVRTALNLIARSTQGISLIVTNPIKNNKVNNFYIKRRPLYEILKSVVTANGYGYSYKGGILKVFGHEEKIFKIPISDLFLKFTSSVGAAGMNSGMSNTNAMQNGANAGQETSGTGTQNIKAGSSNLGGEINMTAMSKKSLYMYLKDNLKVIFTHGKFTIEPKNGIIYLNGRANEVENALKFLNKVKENLSHMVLLKVEVLDVTLNKKFQAGINWNSVFSNAFRGNALGINSLSVGLPLAAANDITNVPELTFGSGANAAIINALSSQGHVTVMSQPRLMLISGETRMISSGTISNYLQTVMTTSLGGLSNTTQTFPVIGQIYSGLGIAFTPYVNYKKKLIRVTISFMDNDVTGYNRFSVSGNTFSEPEISTKSFTDTVIIPNNRTMVIGGILSTNKNKTIYGVPILDKIPLLGDIFKSVNYQKTKDDLIIMITPIISE